MAYRISGIRETGTITYHCSTARGAIEKVKDFQSAEYCEISVACLDDTSIVALMSVSGPDFSQVNLNVQ